MYRKNRIICRNFERVELFLGSFAFSWEQRKFDEIAVRSSTICSDANLPRVEYEDIVSGTGRLNKDIYAKQSSKSGIVFHQGDVLYGKLRPYLQNWLLSTFDGLAVGDFWVLQPQNADSSFLYRLIQSRQFDEVANQSTGTKMPRADWKLVSKTVFSIPSNIREQAAIGTYFTALDHLITLHQRKAHIYTKRAMRPSKQGNHLKTISWEQRKAKELFISTADKGYPDLPVLSATQDRGMIRRDENSINIFHDKKNEAGYKRVLPGQFVIHLRSFQGGFAHSTIEGITSPAYTVFGFSEPEKHDSEYWKYVFTSKAFIRRLETVTYGIRDGRSISYDEFLTLGFAYPSRTEQTAIARYLDKLSDLITLHQRKSPSRKNWRCVMIKETRGIDLFHEYYAKWITVYKKGAIRKVTMDKYLMTQKWLEKLIPDLRVCDMNRIAYQQLLNDYAEHHERQTTMDFHHQLKGAILDAVDEGLIDRDPTRKAIIKGRTPTSKKVKYLNQFELHTLLTSLELKNEVNWDYFILLVAKTGMRFSEALALTPKDFDFSHQTLSINKTWDYKGKGGFQPTKNKSSIRKIQIDWQTVIQFSELVKGFPKDQPIFVKSNVYNSTVNDILGRYCERSNIPVISIHGLRHTHASLLLFAGVSIASVARRLGHSSMTTTQKTYLHIIQELENKDIDLVMRSLSGLS